MVKINHDDRGRVTAVVYADKTGALHEQKACRLRSREFGRDAAFVAEFQILEIP